MIVSLIQTNHINRYHINCWHRRFFSLGHPLYCNGGELIWDQLLLETVLKPHQDPLLTKKRWYPSKIFPKPPGKCFPYLLLQLTQLWLHHHLNQYLITPTCIPPHYFDGRLITRRNKGEFMVIWTYIQGQIFKHLFAFSRFWAKPNSKQANRTACRQTILWWFTNRITD